MPQQRPVSSLAIITAVCAGMCLIGLFGPWIEIGFRTYSGFEGGGLIAFAPVIAVIAASIATVVQPVRPPWTGPTLLIGFIAILALGVIDVSLFVKWMSDAFGAGSFAFNWLGWGVYVYTAGGLLGTIFAIALLATPRRVAQFAAQSPFGPIVINNNANAQLGGQSSGPVQGNMGIPATMPAGSSGAFARIAVLDMGRPLPAITAQAGQVFVVGRDSLADIRLGDPKASRRHLEVTLEPGGWAIRDLGATNPARLLAGGAPNQVIRGSTIRLPAGQVAVGDAVITLYPPGRRG